LAVGVVEYSQSVVRQTFGCIKVKPLIQRHELSCAGLKTPAEHRVKLALHCSVNVIHANKCSIYITPFIFQSISKVPTTYIKQVQPLYHH